MTDHERPLNPRGQNAAAAMRTAMLALGLVPDLVLVSSARRTRETLAGLEPWPDTPLIDVMDTLYLADAATLLATLQAVRDTVRSVLVVAHNPGLHELAVRLAGLHTAPPNGPDARRLAEGYPSGTLAEFDIAGHWGELADGGGRLVRFLCPRDLPAA